MVKSLYAKMKAKETILEVESVCLFGGAYNPRDSLSNLGFMVKKMCSTSTGTLLFETEDPTIKNRLLDFMNKVVYVDLNINTTTDSSNQKLCEIPMETDLTIIAESFDNMRCVSIVVYHGEKILNIFVWDPTKSRQMLFFKSLSPNLTPFEKIVQMKNMDSIHSSNVHLLNSNNYLFNCAQYCVLHVLNDLIPQIQLDQPDSDSSEDENNDE